MFSRCFPGGSVGKEFSCNTGDSGDVGSISRLGRSPGGGHDNPLQYSFWRISRTEEPGRLQFMGSQKVGHNRVPNTCACIF